MSDPLLTSTRLPRTPGGPAAVAAFVGGLLFAAFPLAWHLYPFAVRDELGNPFVAAGPALPLVLGLLAVAALSARRSAGRYGRIAAVVAGLGAGLIAAGSALEFLVFPLVGVLWPDPVWFLGRALVVPGLVLFALGTTAFGALYWRAGIARVGPALTLAWPVGVLVLAGLALLGLPGWAFVLGVTAPVGAAWVLLGSEMLASEESEVV